MKKIACSLIVMVFAALFLSTLTGCAMFAEKEKEPMTVQSFLESERPKF